ncbi:MAG: hypothetical protein U0235_01755 [Polyangiaceae bacterium]
MHAHRTKPFVTLTALVVLASSLVGCGASPASESSEEESAGAIVSTDRAAIFDALRAKVQPEFPSQSILFDVSAGRLAEAAGFVYVEGRVVHPDGSPAVYALSEEDRMLSDDPRARKGIWALLRREGSVFRVLESRTLLMDVAGMEDRPWEEWAQRYGAPSSLFPTNRAGATAEAPDYGVAERTKVMDAFRAVVKPLVRNQDIVFVVTQGGAYEASGRFVFMRGQIRLRGSLSPVDYRGTDFQHAIDVGLFDDVFAALVERKPSGEWTVDDYTIGATDVPWVDWDTRYGAPTAIFR